MSPPLTQSDIIFPSLSNTPSLSSTLHSLKRSALSIHNRLSSITSDFSFVDSVAESYGLPLVANERCGSWYIPPDKKHESCYFKSTDGHTGEWGFSLRRVNLQIVDVVGKCGGCVIVDSTRRGKSMPDALSKTVPIWCCVINRAVFGAEGKQELHTPPQTVSESEHAQIEKRIDGFVRQFLEICKPNVQDMREKLQKPLRPIWVTRESTLPDSPPEFLDFHPVVLCTASKRVRGAEVSEGGYIQGAADDHEAWASGLTPKIFWENKERLLTTNEEDLPDLIANLIKTDRRPDAIPTLIKPTSTIYVSSSQNIDLAPFDVIISSTPKVLTTTQRDIQKRPYLHLPCQAGKLGSRDLRVHLPRLPQFLSSLPAAPKNILICCPTGKDLSVGTALAVLCLYTDDKGTLDTTKARDARNIDKTYIKQKLSWITTSNPALNPSRATLQSVNTILMSGSPTSSSNKTENFQTKSNLLLVDQNGTPIPDSPAPVPNTTTVETKIHALDLNSNIVPTTPTTIFASLQNASRPWTFTRTLTSALPTHPSGTVTGIATFTPCINNTSTSSSIPTPSSPSPSSPTTLLYHEEGAFITSTGLRFSARRKYVYQLKPSENDTNNASEEGGNANVLAIHFFDDDKMRGKGDDAGIGAQGEGIGGLFVEMGDLGLEDGGANGDGVWVARNKEQHLCAEDLYTASWRFGRRVGGESVEWWEVRYDVKGPKKDYVSETRYTRG